MDKKIKELSLKSLLEGGDVKGFLNAHLKTEELESKKENTKVLKSFARLSDMVTQHAKGVFVEEISEEMVSTFEPLLTDLGNRIEKGMSEVAEDIKQLNKETNEANRRDIQQRIDNGIAQLEGDISKSLSSEMRTALNDAMPQLSEDARLTEDEIEEIVTNAALSVESQIPGIIAEYMDEQTISVSDVDGLEAFVKSLLPDLSKVTVQWGQVQGAPKFGGGKNSIKFMNDVDLNGITNGQTVLWNSTLQKFEAGSVDALPSQTGNNGKYLTTNGTTASWATLAGGGDMAAATYDPSTIAEQLVGLTATQTLTNKTLTQPTLVLKQGTAPAPTAEGDIQWDTDDNKIKIGDGAATKTFSDDSYNASTYAAASHTHATTDITSGTFADARIAETNVTQHQAALSITESQISDLDHTDANAIHDNTGSEISAITAKTTPVSGDFFLIEDSQATNAKKALTYGNLQSNLSITESQISDLGTYLTGITGEPLSDLSDVTITTIASGELLKWNGSAWVNNTLAEAGIQPTLDLTLTENVDGFEISGGSTNSRTLTVTGGNITLNGGAPSKGDILVGDAGNDFDAVSVGTNDQILVADSAQTRGVKYVDLDSGFNFIIDGGGSAITTGVKGDVEIPFDCTIESVTMLADQSGSIVVDIWKDTYANFPPTDADSITASATPTISTATKSTDATLTGWTTTLSKGDILRYNVDSITTCERVTISLKVRRNF